MLLKVCLHSLIFVVLASFIEEEVALGELVVDKHEEASECFSVEMIILPEELSPV